MATLPDLDRQRIWRGLMRWWSKYWEQTNFLSADLLAAVAATDNWIDSNAASYNSALPITFRNNATLVQKTMLFCVVALMRVNQSLLRAVVGEID